MLHTLRVLSRPPVLVAQRRAHLLTLPPTIPLRPHPQTAADVSLGLPKAYGWGDWFIAMIGSGFVAWPAIFASDVLFGDFVLPAVEGSGAHPEGALVMGTSFASLLPKLAGSYLGAHLCVPHAWWFWKLSLMPALPVCMALSSVYYYTTWHDNDEANEIDKTDAPRGFNEVDWRETSEEFPQVRLAKKSALVSTAWVPSSSAKRSLTTRFVEAAPTTVQIAILRVWTPPETEQEKKS